MLWNIDIDIVPIHRGYDLSDLRPLQEHQQRQQINLFKEVNVHRIADKDLSQNGFCLSLFCCFSSA